MTRARAGIAWARSRRGAVTTASVAVVCLGTLLAAFGGDSSGEDEGYVAVGAVGATPDRSPQRGVAPTGDVRMVPLDGAGEDSGSGGSGSGGGTDAGTGTGAGGTESGSSEGAPSSGPASPSPSEPDSPSEGGNSGPGEGSSGEPESPGGPGEESQQPSGPAVLKVGEPVRKALEERWCEKVSVKFHNSGGTPVRSGTVTFGTHVIGGLGVDWATIESERKLPAPIEAGETVTESWNLCVDAWRVPLGMHIETQDVSVEWK